ncbi:MAG TPA: helix-turn-helix domain-containing protein [Symbiobacteriaceae bacterium]|nr:helix-turn-helix domain-containing protein [Symbiobacteriaceae bacterium]
MHEIGQQLRAAREAREISLEQAEEETKIRKKYLQALEDETPAVIPGDVYVRGFLRSYANWLGLDGPHLVELYKEQQAGAPAGQPQAVNAEQAEASQGAQPVSEVKAEVRPHKAQPMPTIKRAERHKPGLSGLPLLVACGVLAVVVAGYLIIRSLGNQSAAPPASQPGVGTEPGATSSISTGTTAAAGTATGTAGTGSGTAPGTTATGNPASTQAPATKVTMNKSKGEAVLFDVNGTGPIDVTLQFADKQAVYMKVTVDGKVVAEQTTTDPAKTHWTGKTITIRLGHAETLTAIKVNGETFDKPLKGGPFTLTFAPHT